MKVNFRLESAVFKVDPKNPTNPKPSAAYARVARCLTEAVILANLEHLKAFPKTPLLYDSKVRYKNEPIGLPDEALDIPAILRKGWGDCLHLTAWRVAELRLKNENAKPAFTWKHFGDTKSNRLFHVIVRRANGTIEDPSAILGM